MKNLSSIYIAFENYSQQVQIDVFYAISGKNAKKNTKAINILKSPQ